MLRIFNWTVGLILLIGGLVYLALYGFTVFVALVTSGSELLVKPQAWYAALIPMIFVTFCIYTVFSIKSVERKKLMFGGVALCAITIPAIWVSFLGYGVFLPVFMVLWVMYFASSKRTTHNQ